MDGLGVRCVSDEPWVTAAETAECALAHVAAGERERPRPCCAWTRPTGVTTARTAPVSCTPRRSRFPVAEHTAYTAAAVILAADALTGASPAAALFAAPSVRPERLIIVGCRAHQPSDQTLWCQSVR